MIAVTRGIGIALIAISALTYPPTGEKTALLPAALGLILLVLSFVAAKEHLKRHAIHAALALALLGCIGSAPRALPLLTGDDPELPMAAWASLATALLTLAYVILGVRSFINARRAERVSAGD